MPGSFVPLAMFINLLEQTKHLFSNNKNFCNSSAMVSSHLHLSLDYHEKENCKKKVGHLLFTDDKAEIHAKNEDKEEYGAIFWQQPKSFVNKIFGNKQNIFEQQKIFCQEDKNLLATNSTRQVFLPSPTGSDKAAYFGCSGH